MQKIAVYPGTFDPITNGHLDILSRASKLFDKVILAIAKDNYKNTIFNIEERLELARITTQKLPNVEVVSFGGLLVNFCKEQNASVIIRGLRALSDFENEFQMALMNKGVAPEIESLFLMADPKFQFVSSSMVKNFAEFDVYSSEIVQPAVRDALCRKFGENHK
ncbi:MAG: pantetheine-phosphate adenylyltransferase [Bacillota bacterium]|jgi:pantetheine-phosphate adenylyltransferase